MFQTTTLKSFLETKSVSSEAPHGIVNNFQFPLFSFSHQCASHISCCEKFHSCSLPLFQFDMNDKVHVFLHRPLNHYS